MTANEEIALFARLAQEPKLRQWLEREAAAAYEALKVQTAPGVHVAQGKAQTIDKMLKLLAEAPKHARSHNHA